MEKDEHAAKPADAPVAREDALAGQRDQIVKDYAFFPNLLKNFVLLGLVFGVSRLVSTLSLPAATGVFLLFVLPIFLVSYYFHILDKTKGSMTFHSQGWIIWLLNLRNLLLAVVFFLAVFTAFGLVLHLPGLDEREWLFIVLTAPVCFTLITRLAFTLLRHESVAWLVMGRSLRWAFLATPFLMVALYALSLHFLASPPAYESLDAAKIAQPQPWAASSSAFLQEAGAWSVLLGAYWDFGFTRLSAFTTRYLYIIPASLGYLAIFWGMCSILAFFSIPRTELRRLVAPLTPGMALKVSPGKVVWFMFFLGIGTGGVFYAADSLEAFFLHNKSPQKVRSTLEHQIDKGALAALQAKLQGGQEMRDGHQARLQPKTQALESLRAYYSETVFRVMERNVDAFLDWNYSLSADYTRIAKLLTGEIEEYMLGELRRQLEAGLDPQGAEKILLAASEHDAGVIAEYNAARQQWIDELRSQFPADILPRSLEDFLPPLRSPAVEYVTFDTRLKISGGVGAAGAGVAAMVANKVAGKSFFKAMAGALGKAAASKVVSAAGGVAVGGGICAGLGAAIGGLIIPGLGAVPGAAVGGLICAAGAAVGMEDKAVLELEGMVPREEYKSALLDAVEEAKRDILSNLEKDFALGQ